MIEVGPATEVTSRTAAYVRDDHELHYELGILTQHPAWPTSEAGQGLLVPIESLERFVAQVLAVAEEVADDLEAEPGRKSRNLSVAMRLASVESSVQLMRKIYMRRVVPYVAVSHVDQALETIILKVRDARGLL